MSSRFSPFVSSSALLCAAFYSSSGLLHVMSSGNPRQHPFSWSPLERNVLSSQESPKSFDLNVVGLIWAKCRLCSITMAKGMHALISWSIINHMPPLRVRITHQRMWTATGRSGSPRKITVWSSEENQWTSVGVGSKTTLVHIIQIIWQNTRWLWGSWWTSGFGGHPLSPGPSQSQISCSLWNMAKGREAKEQHVPPVCTAGEPNVQEDCTKVWSILAPAYHKISFNKRKIAII